MNQPAQNPNFDPSATPFKAFQRMADELSQSGIDDESVGFIIGRLVSQVADKLALELIELIGEDEMKRLESIEDEAERQRQTEDLFEQKKGISLADYREQLAEEMVQDFEAQG